MTTRGALAMATALAVAAALVVVAARAFDAAPAEAQERGPGWLCGTNEEAAGAEWLVLDSGLRFKSVRDASVPLVTFHVRIPGGASTDPPELAGRAALLAEWVGRGAGGLSAEAFRQAVEARGGSLEVYAAPRWIAIDAEFLAEDALLGLGLVMDALVAPTFDPDEVRKARDLTLARLSQLRTDPNEATGAYWDAWLFGGHPFGNPSAGDEASLARIADPAALTRRWAEIARPENTFIVVAGDVEELKLRTLIASKLAAHERAPVATALPPTLPVLRRGGVLLVDHPEALQTYFRFGGPGLPRDDPDHAARYLANTILGGRFTSRLNTALRIESGLTYGARSRFDDDRGGAFAVSTYTETGTSGECIELAQEVYARFVENGLTADELTSARAYVKGQFAPDELETPAQRAAWMLDLSLSGLPWSFIDGFFARLDAVTLDDVNRVITQRFPQGGELAWVVIGQADVLRPIVGKLGEVTEVKLSEPGFGPRK